MAIYANGARLLLILKTRTELWILIRKIGNGIIDGRYLILIHAPFKSIR